MPEDNSHAGQGAVMLDIGGDIGALIVEMPAEMEGVEVEIRPLDWAGDGAQASAHDHSDQHDHSHQHDHDHDHSDQHDHEHGHLIHVAVVGRPAVDGIHYTLVYPELTAGTYELYERPAGPVKLTASVTGGEVTTESWPL